MRLSHGAITGVSCTSGVFPGGCQSVIGADRLSQMPPAQGLLVFGASFCSIEGGSLQLPYTIQSDQQHRYWATPPAGVNSSLYITWYFTAALTSAGAIFVCFLLQLYSVWHFYSIFLLVRRSFNLNVNATLFFPAEARRL